MDSVIKIDRLCKEFKTLNRREGLRGSLLDLFSRNYNTIKAVNNVSVDIVRGEIVGFLGPNGAGKSTTIKIMTGVMEPTSGEIYVNDRVPYKNRTQNAQNIGVVFGQRSQLWWSLPLIESFRILKDIYQVSDKEFKDMIELFEYLTNISELYNKPIRQMSLGQRTLSDILSALLHNPSVVFLDEPTIGLDVSMKSKIRQLIKEFNKEKKTTVILTTHDMGDVDALCRRIIIIDKGTVLYDNNIENLKSFFGSYRTLKILCGKETADYTAEILNNKIKLIEKELKKQYFHFDSPSISIEEEWISILVNEDEITIIELMNAIQKILKINDMKLEEISTESVIKKIYEGGIV